MTITSKLVFRTLVVLMGLFIFVRGMWLNFFHPEPLSMLDLLNAAISMAMLAFLGLILFGIIVIVIAGIGDYIIPIWAGDKQLFKPFKINFKFKKK